MSKFAVIKLDETDRWPENIQAPAGRIFGVYLVDLSKHVHCCELTPSYELNWIENQYTDSPEDETESERLYDAIRGVSSPLVEYFHTRWIDSLPYKEEGFPEANQTGCIILQPELDEMVEGLVEEEISIDELIGEMQSNCV